MYESNIHFLTRFKEVLDSIWISDVAVVLNYNMIVVLNPHSHIKEELWQV